MRPGPPFVLGQELRGRLGRQLASCEQILQAAMSFLHAARHRVSSEESANTVFAASYAQTVKRTDVVDTSQDAGQNNLLTAGDIQKRLRVSRSQAYALMRRMPHLKIEGSVRVTEADFAAWLRGHAVARP